MRYAPLQAKCEKDRARAGVGGGGSWGLHFAGCVPQAFYNPYHLSVENATPINPAVNMRLLLAAHFISLLPECAPSSSTEDGKFLHGKRASPLNLWFLKVSRDEDHKRGLLSA